MFKLVIEDDEGNKTVVPVIRDEITIGRKEGNTIRLTERNVSRRHGRLVRENGSIYFEEIDARYGTRKNGDKIGGRAEFGMGDVLTIGDYRLTLKADVAPEAKRPARSNGSAGAEQHEFSNVPTQVTNRDDIERRAEQGTEVLPALPAKLVIISSNFAGQEFPLTRREMVIGRGEECDIIIDHRSVSQKHAKVVRESPTGEYKIVDLKSKNGVKVSGEEYRAVHLKRGDVVELGHVKFRFVEAGENYVFTPQPAGGTGDDFSDVTAPTGNRLPLVGVVVAVLVAAGALGYFVLRSPEPDASATVEPTAPAMARAQPEPAEPAPPPEDASNEKVAELLERGRGAFEAGQMEKAIAALDTARALEPSPEQIDQIEDLLSRARREKPYARQLDIGRDHFNNGRFTEALGAFGRIPPDESSVIYAILMDEDYPARSVTKIIEEANAAVEEGALDRAEAMVREIQLYDKEHADAAALLEEIQRRRTQVAEAEKSRRASSRRKSNRNKASGSSASAPKFQPNPEKGKELFLEAQKLVVQAQWDQAINKCQEGLKHRFNGCHRVLAVSYKNKGDVGRACKHFDAAGTADHGLDCP